MQIEVFKTNVKTKKNADRVIKHIKKEVPVGRINFDLEDRDKILRIEAKEIQVQPIQLLLFELGFTCTPLELLKQSKMNNNSLFDFIVDKPTKTVSINMEFDAELPLVWDAFTKKEILDQWYAPAPWKSKTKHMNFEVGGRRFYAMVGPEGQEMWAV